MKEISINSIIDLKNLATRLYNEVKIPVVFFLNGDLGSGKTTFVQQFAEILDIKQSIRSPSFTLHNEYEGLDNIKLHHLDLYRLQLDKELEELKLKDTISDNSYIFIEWAEKFEKELNQIFQPINRYQLDFEMVEENTRLVKITKL